jgi:hypothetical protein
MIKISYSSYRFPPEIIQHAIWLYIRFTQSFRDGEDLLAERLAGLERILVSNSAFSNCSLRRFHPNEGANSNMAEFVRALSAVLARLDKT